MPRRRRRGRSRPRGAAGGLVGRRSASLSPTGAGCVQELRKEEVVALGVGRFDASECGADQNPRGSCEIPAENRIRALQELAGAMGGGGGFGQDVHGRVIAPVKVAR